VAPVPDVRGPVRDSHAGLTRSVVEAFGGPVINGTPSLEGLAIMCVRLSLSSHVTS
jgi:hypothetical protein